MNPARSRHVPEGDNKQHSDAKLVRVGGGHKTFFD